MLSDQADGKLGDVASINPPLAARCGEGYVLREGSAGSPSTMISVLLGSTGVARDYATVLGDVRPAAPTI